MSVVIQGERPSIAELAGLYAAVGWSAYTDDLDTPERALCGSTIVLTARIDGRLVGLARVISDGATIAYLQNILVLPEAQRLDVGGRLLDEMLARTSVLRQFVLLTDDEQGQRAFYESRGLVEVSDVTPEPLRSFIRP